MKKIFSFLCMFMAMTAMISCSSSKEEKGTTGTGNAALDNIFERKSVRTYLNKGVEKEKIDLMLRAGMSGLLHRERMFVPGSLWLFPTVRNWIRWRRLFLMPKC